MKRAVRRLRGQQRRWWPTPSIVLAGAALFVVLGGSAVAANGLIHAGDIAPGAVTSGAIRSGAVEPRESQHRHASTAAASPAAPVRPAERIDGANGRTAPWAKVRTGQTANGATGDGEWSQRCRRELTGSTGRTASTGPNWGERHQRHDRAALGDNRARPPFRPAPPLTTVVELAVPAGNYVVLAKTQLSHTGAGDTVECVLQGRGRRRSTRSR